MLIVFLLTRLASELPPLDLLGALNLRIDLAIRVVVRGRCARNRPLLVDLAASAVERVEGLEAILVVLERVGGVDGERDLGDLGCRWCLCCGRRKE